MIANIQPLLTVVIPTYKRPKYLLRAVKSALQAAPDGDVEVIVVPNGGDETWKESLALLLDDSRIIVSPIEKGHANVARNHGLRLAKGKYIRFLDDDDFFYSQNCQQQLKALMSSNANLAVANFDIGSDQGDVWHVMPVSKKYNDFHSLILAFDRITHVCSYLYERKFLENIEWDETCNLGQDVLFIFDIICYKRNINYIVDNYSTGVWVQHASERISTSNKIDIHHRASYRFVMNAIRLLDKSALLNEQRRKIAIDSLWIYAHHGFFHNPFFWSRKILEILIYDIDSRPDDKIYSTFNFIHPLVIEWLFYPYRYLKHFFKKMGKNKNIHIFWE